MILPDRFRPTRAANASLVWTMRQLVVHDGDEIDERVERVLEQPPLPQDVVEQLDVLDPDRQLPRQLVGELEELAVVDRVVRGVGLVGGR